MPEDFDMNSTQHFLLITTYISPNLEKTQIFANISNDTEMRLNFEMPSQTSATLLKIGKQGSGR